MKTTPSGSTGGRFMVESIGRLCLSRRALLIARAGLAEGKLTDATTSGFDAMSRCGRQRRLRRVA